MDRQWLPEREGYSLYVRPFMFSSAHTLGVGRPTRSTLAITLSPVGPYFATGALFVMLRMHAHGFAAAATSSTSAIFCAPRHGQYCFQADAVY